MTYRKIALITLALAVCLPLAALAEPGFGRHHGPGRGFFPPPGYLDLSEEQIEAVEALRETVRADMEAHRTEARALHEQLRTALENESPDPAQVGQLVIDLHRQKEQGRAAWESVESQFAALLTPEQLEKWENFKELRGNRRERRHERGFGEGLRQGPPF